MSTFGSCSHIDNFVPFNNPGDPPFAAESAPIEAVFSKIRIAAGIVIILTFRGKRSIFPRKYWGRLN